MAEVLLCVSPLATACSAVSVSSKLVLRIHMMAGLLCERLVRVCAWMPVRVHAWNAHEAVPPVNPSAAELFTEHH